MVGIDVTRYFCYRVADFYDVEEFYLRRGLRNSLTSYYHRMFPFISSILIFLLNVLQVVLIPYGERRWSQKDLSNKRVYYKLNERRKSLKQRRQTKSKGGEFLEKVTRHARKHNSKRKLTWDVNTKNQAFLSHSIGKLHTDFKEIIFGVSGSGFKFGSL
jgi:hypothetical protein